MWILCVKLLSMDFFQTLNPFLDQVLELPETFEFLTFFTCRLLGYVIIQLSFALSELPCNSLHIEDFNQ